LESGNCCDEGQQKENAMLMIAGLLDQGECIQINLTWPRMSDFAIILSDRASMASKCV
jgi:hypothetical protein